MVSTITPVPITIVTIDSGLLKHVAADLGDCPCVLML